LIINLVFTRRLCWWQYPSTQKEKTNFYEVNSKRRQLCRLA